MQQPERAIREVALPATALTGLRRALRSETGALEAIHALHAAGYDAGEALHESFARDEPGAADLPLEVFWERFGSFLSRRGWGTLRHREVHGGIGTLETGDGAESDPSGDPESQPACAFTSGLLSSLLTRVADGPVAVLEVTCRSRGDDRCTFAFGSEAAVHELYGLLLEGEEMDGALERL